MKLLIVDNEAPLRKALRLMLDAEVTGITSIDEAESVQSGIASIKKNLPDVVLLDVEMEDGTGFDLLQQLGNTNFQIIFVTAHNEYAIKAFQFSAIDYLLKPVNPEALKKSIERAAQNIRNANLHGQVQVLLQQLSGIQNADKKIVLKDIDNTYFVNIKDILYCEAEGTYTKFYLVNEAPLLVSKNLKEYAMILEPAGFLRTHHSFLVNADKIKLFDKKDGGLLVLDSGASIPISQRKKEFVMQMLEKR